MHGVLRVTSILFALSLMLAACADATTQTASQAVMPVIGPTASYALSDTSTATDVSSTVTPIPASPTLTSAPTSTPQPTSDPMLAQDVRVAGVNVSKMSLESARQKIADALSP